MSEIASKRLNLGESLIPINYRNFETLIYRDQNQIKFSGLLTGRRIMLGCQGFKSVCRHPNVNMRGTTGIVGRKIALKPVLSRFLGKNRGTVVIII